MFAERADAVITRVAGHNAQKTAQQKPRWGYNQRQPTQTKSGGESSAQSSGGPEPMELGTTRCGNLSRAEYEKFCTERACFI